MRIAILSDIHGNLTALEAVLTDLRASAPDVVLLGGDLADGGASPAEVVDRLREMRWDGVLGNGDDMLARPETMEVFAAGSAAPPAIWSAVRDGAAFARQQLGAERLAWLGALPESLLFPGLALVHATPGSCWHTPPANAAEAALECVYGPLERACVVFGHTHIPSVRKLIGSGMTLVNAGSVGLSYDGDPRASYALLVDGQPQIQRVSYDVDAECESLRRSGHPTSSWISAMLRSAAPRLP